MARGVNENAPHIGCRLVTRLHGSERHRPARSLVEIVDRDVEVQLLQLARLGPGRCHVVLGAHHREGHTAGPVPVVTFHGTQDSYVPYDGSPSRSAAQLPAPDGSHRTLANVKNENVPGAAITRSVLNGGSAVPDTLASWAARERCRAGAPAQSRIGPDVTLLRYDCPAGSAVELYRVAGGGHAWPGSPGSAALAAAVGRTTFTINADSLMWAFFRAHPLPASVG